MEITSSKRSEELRIARGVLLAIAKRGRLFADRVATGNRQRHLRFIKNIYQCRIPKGAANTEKSGCTVRCTIESLTPLCLNKKYLTLVSRIREELSEVKKAVDRTF